MRKTLVVSYLVSAAIVVAILLASHIAYGQFDAVPPDMGGTGFRDVPTTSTVIVGTGA